VKANRLVKKFNLGGSKFVIRGLFPSDFLSEGYWPIRFYHLKGEQQEPMLKWNYEGGIKPRWMLENEARMRKIVSLGVVKPEIVGNNLVSLFQDKQLEVLKNFLIGNIFFLTYGVKDNSMEGRELSREHLEEIGIKARELKREPWEIVYGSDSLPDGLNPRRHDFNNLTMIVMFDRDKRLGSYNHA
jgi:hypothetical protein